MFRKISNQNKIPEDIIKKMREVYGSYGNDYLRSNLYDRMEEISFPSYYPIETIMFESRSDNKLATLNLYSNNVINLQYLDELFRSPEEKERHHHFNYYGVNFEFDGKDPVAAIKKLKNLFANLSSALKIQDGYSFDLAEAEKRCLQFLEKYCLDYAEHFPGYNYFIRNMEKNTPRTAETKNSASQESEAIFSAIRQRNPDELQKLLSTLSSPDSLYFYGAYLPTYIMPEEDEASEENLLHCFLLLLVHGVEIHEKYGRHSLLASIYWEFILHQKKPKHFSILNHMLRMIMELDNSRTFTYATEAMKKDELINDILKGQTLVAKKRLNMQRMKLFSSPNLIKSFQIKNITISVQTKLLDEIMKDGLIKDNSLYAELEKLFMASPPWCHYLNKNKLKETFYEIMSDVCGKPYIDLVYKDNELVGYNILQMIPVRYKDEEIIIHHAKLELAKDCMHHYRGLMFYLLYYHGFSPINHDSKTKVITVFEAASIASNVQVAKFRHYPKVRALHPLMEILKKTIYKETQDRIFETADGRWRIMDSVAYFPKKDEPVEWHTFNTLAKSLLFTKPLPNGESNIIMLEWDDHNKLIFQEKLAQFGIQLDTRSTLLSFPPRSKL